ncbi:hypothetical protein C5Z26_09615 [Lactobacillus sp. CBA3606]|nr:hypothetical protein C5Z26_09615 [Lactobacillus sp. CBA3606]
MTSFWQQLFHHATVTNTASLAATKAEKSTIDEWVIVPKYIDVDPREQVIPALIAASVAVDQAANSQLSLKRLAVQNPEAQLVSIIASSCALAMGDRTFVIKSIRKRVDQY